MRRSVVLLLAACSYFSSQPAVHAQTERAAKQKDLLVDIDVGYNTAYREKSWIPVTVDIVNEQRDFDGSIEVRTYDYSNVQQSPIYRLAAQCPRNSRKRYTLYVNLNGAERVEAWLYERGRRAVDAPAYMQVRPIGKDDLLVAVLDDDPFNYGFLYAAVQRKGKVVRVSRFGLPTSDLERLPDLSQAYESFDAIVFGDIDPDRVAQRHRALITEYVQSGGTLIVSTGTNAADYRDSWLAPLLGTTIGETVMTTEADLAASLPESARSGLRPDRQAILASLRPAEGVVSTGLAHTLATRNTIGRGRIYTVALDATSRAMQDTAGYQTLWRDMIVRPPEGKALNLDAFAQTVTQVLPNLSGVKIRPLKWVMTYLLLYLGVGIVANWFFWNAFKRREMAWFCLIGFSFAFTAYAVLFGRSGNLREAQHQTVGVVRVSPGEKRAEVYSLTGILSSRTRTYSGALQGESVAVRDAAIHSTDNFDPYGRMQTTVRNARPFRWDQTEPSRIEALRVGASELRMMLVQGWIPASGAIEGTIEIDQDGMRGTLRNDTGYEFTQAALVYDGLLFPMSVRSGGTEIVLDVAKAKRIREEGEREDYQQRQLARVGYIGYGGDLTEDTMRDYAQRALFAGETGTIDFQYPPYLVAWCRAAPGAGLAPDQTMTLTSAQTLVASPVNVRDARLFAQDTALSVNFGNGWYRSRSGPPADKYQNQTNYATTLTPGSVHVLLPDGASSAEAGELLIELYWQSIDPKHRVILAPASGKELADPADFAWHEAHAGDDENVNYGELNRRTVYRITDWDKHLESGGRSLQFGIADWRPTEEQNARNRRSAMIPNMIRSEYSASARYISHEKPANEQGVWPQWR